MMTRAIGSAHISGQGEYDKFIRSDLNFTDGVSSKVDLIGFYKIIGIGGWFDNGGTLWVYK